MTNIRIALVEDDTILCDLLKIRLAKMGYKVSGVYSSGEVAIHDMSGNLPDLVLMDIGLSGKLDGVVTAQLIQKQYTLPVVFLTANTDPATFERAKITEECEYIVKPFTDKDLFIAIELAYHKFTLNRGMRARHLFLERIVRSMDDAVIATDEDGFVTLMNPAAEELIGTPFKSVRKLHFREIVTVIDEGGRVVESPVDRVKIGLGPLDFPKDAFLVSAKGDRIQIRGSVSPLKDEKGKYLGIIFLISPINKSHFLQYTGKRKF